jgi:hypothetical protein
MYKWRETELAGLKLIETSSYSLRAEVSLKFQIKKRVIFCSGPFQALKVKKKFGEVWWYLLACFAHPPTFFFSIISILPCTVPYFLKKTIFLFKE